MQIFQVLNIHLFSVLLSLIYNSRYCSISQGMPESGSHTTAGDVNADSLVIITGQPVLLSSLEYIIWGSLTSQMFTSVTSSDTQCLWNHASKESVTIFDAGMFQTMIHRILYPNFYLVVSNCIAYCILFWCVTMTLFLWPMIWCAVFPDLTTHSLLHQYFLCLAV